MFVEAAGFVSREREASYTLYDRVLHFLRDNTHFNLDTAYS